MEKKATHKKFRLKKNIFDCFFFSFYTQDTLCLYTLKRLHSLVSFFIKWNRCSCFCWQDFSIMKRCFLSRICSCKSCANFCCRWRLLNGWLCWFSFFQYKYTGINIHNQNGVLSSCGKCGCHTGLPGANAKKQQKDGSVCVTAIFSKSCNICCARNQKEKRSCKKKNKWIIKKKIFKTWWRLRSPAVVVVLCWHASSIPASCCRSLSRWSGG